MGCFLRIEHKTLHDIKNQDDKFIEEWMQKIYDAKVVVKDDVFITTNISYWSLDGGGLIEQIHLTPFDLSIFYGTDSTICVLLWQNITSIEVVGDVPSEVARKILDDILKYWKLHKGNLIAPPTEKDLIVKAIERERNKPKL